MQIVLPSDDFFTGRTKYAIQPEGKKALDLLSEKLKDYSYEKIVISSYTDFRDSTFFKSAVGSISRNTRETPNEVITKTRAISVRDYLAKEAPSKLSMSSIEAVGKGSADAKATDLCAKSNPKLLNKCLAVDRRIVIEVVGLTDKKPSIASNSNTSN